jgi:hypothetical protein
LPYYTETENFPFKQKVVEVLGGIRLGHEEGYAEKVVESFMKNLEQKEIKTIEV